MKHLKKFNESFDKVDIENIFLELEEDTELDLSDSVYTENFANICIYILTKDAGLLIHNITELDKTLNYNEKMLFIFKKLKVACLRLEYYGYEYKIETDLNEYAIYIDIKHKDFKPDLKYILDHRDESHRLFDVFKDNYGLTLLKSSQFRDGYAFIINDRSVIKNTKIDFVKKDLEKAGYLVTITVNGDSTIIRIQK